MKSSLRWGSALTAASLLAASSAASQDDVLVDIDDLSPHELVTQGLSLTTAQDLRIEAVGAERRWDERRWRWRGWTDDDDRGWVGNAWILDARTRDLVWELRFSDAETNRADLEEFSGVVRLGAGEYIVHYASYSGRAEWDDEWRRESGAEPRYEDDGMSEEFGIMIRGAGRRLSRREIEGAADAFRAGAVASFARLGTAAREAVAFELDAPTRLDIYAVGEVTDGGTYDYAWLVNTETREVVWRLEKGGSRYAGGAGKNRIARRRIELEPGSYAAIAVTDDSHDASDWNAPPPYDPALWGLTIHAADPGADIETSAYRSTAPENVFLSLRGLGDGALMSEGFTLSQKLDVRVYALGEGSEGRMYDQGWIIDASTRRAVWEMTYARTDHAGGAAKNRAIDEVITLEPGDYVALYATDGSHSPREWNSAPPLDEGAWGITLISQSGGDWRRTISSYDPASNPSIIARLVGIRDDERRRQRFSLDSDSKIRVYALGEGTNDRMYDYAWIEDARGEIVWEMSYRSTDRAGGAQKNRLYDDTISLPAGDYVLHYRSDGSHSFADWNADPPSDAISYGVTLFATR